MRYYIARRDDAFGDPVKEPGGKSEIEIFLMETDEDVTDMDSILPSTEVSETQWTSSNGHEWNLIPQPSNS